MNGPTHFQQSEAIIAAVMDQHPPEAVAANMLAAAQVHATLALAAATAEGVSSPEFGPLVSCEIPEDVAFPGSPASPASPWGEVLR